MTGRAADVATVELTWRPSTASNPLCDLCWAQEHVEDDPNVYRDRLDRDVKAITYVNTGDGQDHEAVSLCEEHLRVLKAFVRGLKW